MKAGFSEGRIKHWSKGLTAEEHPSIASGVSKRQKLIDEGWAANKDDPAELIKKITKSLGTDWLIVSKASEEELRSRSKNTDYTIDIMCLSCDNIESRSIYNIVRHQKLKCQKCSAGAASAGQLEVFEWICSLGVKAYSCDRSTVKGWELDVSVPDRQFALDYNGLYWHSELIQTNKSQHDTKSRAVAAVGIRLFHLFEDEWHNKKKIVKSMILHRLNMTDRRVSARKCTVSIIDHRAASKFFDASHIDGHTRATITFALKLDDTIIAALSLRPSMQLTHGIRMEIARFATDLNTSCPGALGKLTRAAIDWTKANRPNCIGLITYADGRFGGGDGYVTSGWKDAGHTGIGFWWTDCTKRYNRMFVKATSEISEKEHAKLRRVTKIWGCRHRRFLLDF